MLGWVTPVTVELCSTDPSIGTKLAGLVGVLKAVTGVGMGSSSGKAKAKAC